jgi:hypothetical protein
MHVRIGFKAGGLETRFDHAQPAKRKNGAFERLIGLQPDNHLVLFIDIAGLMRQHGRWRLRINGKHSLFLFVPEIRLQFIPDRLGPFRWPCEKFFVTGIGSGVPRNKITNVDRACPNTRLKTTPTLLVLLAFAHARRAFHSSPPWNWLLLRYLSALPGKTYLIKINYSD